MRWRGGSRQYVWTTVRRRLDRRIRSDHQFARPAMNPAPRKRSSGRASGVSQSAPLRRNGRAGSHGPSARRTTVAPVSDAFAADATAAHAPRGSKASPTLSAGECVRAPVVSALMRPLRRIDRSVKIPSTVCGLFAAIVCACGVDRVLFVCRRSQPSVGCVEVPT